MKTTLFSTLAWLSLTAVVSQGSITVSQSVSQTRIVAGKDREVVVRIKVCGGDEPVAAPRGKRPEMNLGLVLDRSGSMKGLRIEQAREAARMAVRQMLRHDHLSLVSFGAGVTVDVASTRVTAPARFESAIAEMHAAGFTPLYQGVETGAAEVRKKRADKRINRVLLMSDGHANRGPSTPEELADLGARLASAGISVTTIGVGDSFNEDLMTSLAAASDANYYYVRDVEELPGVFEQELGSLVSSVARDIRIRIECGAGVTPVEVMGRPDSVDGRVAEVGLGLLQAGQERSIYVRCRIDDDQLAHENARLPIASSRVDFRLANGERAAPVNSQPVSVELVASEAAAVESVDDTVVTEVAVLEAAEVRNRAIESNDAGDYDAAGAILRGRADELEEMASQVAEPAARAQLDREATAMRREADEAAGGALPAASRKALQDRAWQQLNSKQELIEKDGE